MDSSFRIDGNLIFFEFLQDKDDVERIKELKFKMADIEPYVKIDQNLNPGKINNDLIALSIIMMVNPFVGNNLYFDFSVSKRFIQIVEKVISRYKITCKDFDNIPLKAERGSKPGLAFSGGADSSAALSIMPKDVSLVFMNRPMEKKSVYDSSAPLEICRRLEEIGFDVEVIETNLEYLREPVGFPTDLANSIPAILHSEYLDLDSIAFGTVLESGYGIGHEHYIDYSKGAHYRFFSTLFNSVGLELSLPTLGISEVGTAIIGNKAPGGILQQSCIRGKLFEPCFRCWKCFRKELLNYSLGFVESPPNFEEMMRSNEIQQRLSAYPISHENVITYSLQRINFNDIKNLKVLSSKLDMNKKLGFLEEWYPPSIEFVPDKYRFTIREKIIKYLSVMRLRDQNLITNWQMDEHLKSSKTKLGQEKLLKLWDDINHK